MTAKKNPHLTKREALIASWKDRKDFKGYEKGPGTAYNSWRAALYTEKGRMIGSPESWRDFRVFMKEVGGEWAHGKVVCRLDSTKPHSPENSFWADKGSENSGRLVMMSYNGETKTLVEWCEQFGLNYQGVRQRYFKGKGLSSYEVLFGKQKKVRTPKDRDIAFRTLRMLGAYRLTDRKRGLQCDITIDQFRELITNGCVYCGDTEKVGLDRIDNSVGHIISNVVPCCYSCNTARNKNFTHQEMIIIGRAIKEVKESRNAKNDQC